MASRGRFVGGGVEEDSGLGAPVVVEVACLEAPAEREPRDLPPLRKIKMPETSPRITVRLIFRVMVGVRVR